MSEFSENNMWGSLLAVNHNNPNPFLSVSLSLSQVWNKRQPRSLQTSLDNSSQRLQSGRWRRERQIRVYGNESIRLNSDRQIVLSTELLQRRAALRAAGTVLNTIRRLFKQRERWREWRREGDRKDSRPGDTAPSSLTLLINFKGEGVKFNKGKLIDAKTSVLARIN